MLDLLRAILALLLIFFIPGFITANAIFPRKGELDIKLDMLYRAALGIGLSIVITILTGFFLNALGPDPDTGIGYFTTWYIILSLSLVSIITFGIGWWRGAYQFMGNWHPKLIRPVPQDPRSLTGPMFGNREKGFEHRQLVEKKFKAIDKINELEKKEDMHDGETADYYREKISGTKKTLREIEARLIELEQEEEV